MKKMSLYKNKNGQALIEFILVASILIILLHGIVDFVHMGITKHILDSACREGVRAATSIPSLQNNDAIALSRVRKIMMDGGLMTKSYITQPLPAPQIHFIRGGTDGGATAQKGDIIVVTTSVQYNSFFSNITRSSWTLNGKAVSKYLL